MADGFVTQRRVFHFSVAAMLATLLIGTPSSAEPTTGWTSTGGESTVFVAPRDDGRTVGVYAQPAKKGAITGILVRLTLTGFADKKLALREDALVDLFAFHLFAAKKKNPTILVVRDCPIEVGYDLGGVEKDIRTGLFDVLDSKAALNALEIRKSVVDAAASAGGDLTKRFVTANSQTVQKVATGSRGKVVRVIHAALINAAK